VAGLASTSLRSPGPAARRTDMTPARRGHRRSCRTVPQREHPGTAFVLLLQEQDAGHCRIVDLGAQALTGDRYLAATPAELLS